jgi:hypothetical protein
VKATLHQLDDFVALRLRPDDTATERIEDEPPGWDLAAPFYFLWDAEKLEHGEWDLLGLKVRIERITEQQLADLACLNLPNVDLADAGLLNASIPEFLRWAKRIYEERRIVA